MDLTDKIDIAHNEVHIIDNNGINVSKLWLESYRITRVTQLKQDKNITIVSDYMRIIIDDKRLRLDAIWDDIKRYLEEEYPKDRIEVSTIMTGRTITIKSNNRRGE